MALKADYIPYRLIFKQPAITSRAVMLEKETFFLRVWDESNPEVFGLGECSLFRGLSAEDTPYYEKVLDKACRTIDSIDVLILQKFSSIRFGIESALRDLENGGKRIVYDTPWSRGESAITINGLIWMGTEHEMLSRIDSKLNEGFQCLKLKIGGIDFDREIEILRKIRDRYSPATLQLRLDANGSFSPENAMDRLNRLSDFSIHSIEQPLAPRQWIQMEELCRTSPIPIALDEELIGVNDPKMKHRLLETIRPAYIILKPSLCGGLTGSYEWIQLADEFKTGWWLTSALESNVGLNAIAQFASTFNLDMPQGLGTGELYVNNIPSPIERHGQDIVYDIQKPWNLSSLK